MRNNIVHIGADELSYEIREIALFANELSVLGLDIFWENIGDPVEKGAKVPDWIKEIVKKAVSEDCSFAYSPTAGLLETRRFLVEERKRTNHGVILSEDDTLFFNGLGDAISKIYTYLRKEARVIGPSPAYPTHSSAEGAHAGSAHLIYELNPHRNWLPDLEDLRNKVKYNSSIAGILIINPDNPTGMIYPKRVLEEIVKIAKEFDLFIISDEVYANISYGDEEMVPLYKVIGDVPAIVMRGLSKEIPWPGARCGWIEVYNKDKDPIFARYIKTLVDAKRLEVCSTTLPQKVLPTILSDKRYGEYLKEKNDICRKRAGMAYEAFGKVSGIKVVKPAGAFYVSIVFEDGVLSGKQKLNIENEEVRNMLEDKIFTETSLDKRFVYYLLASTGICVVTLSGFNSDLDGFRMTLLEIDDEKFKWLLETISDKIGEYLKS